MKKVKRNKRAEQTSESPFQRFREMAKRVVSAPKKLADKS